MTRNDYNILASALRRLKPGYGGNKLILKHWHKTVNEITNACIEDNPKFNAEQFRSACGAQE